MMIKAGTATSGPSLRAMSTPPTIVPARIASDVPVSTSPFPPTSSSSLSIRGRIEYLTGPKSVDCRPKRKRVASRSATLRCMNPIAPRIAMAISSSFVARMTRALSYLSASCPAVAENRKKGRMKSAPARFTSTSGRIPPACATWNAIRMTSAFLKTLSLNAPRNWVVKNGPNRRSASSLNWLRSAIIRTAPRQAFSRT